MSCGRYFGVWLVLLAFALPTGAAAQSEDVSLGDLARSLRKAKEPAAMEVIDNDNLAKVVEDVEALHLSTRPKFSFDVAGKQFKVSSPDGTCSLSFNANVTALLSSPYVVQDLPAAELSKLDGPASIHDGILEVSLYNSTSWNVKEITLGLTVVREADVPTEYYGAAKLLPAVAVEEAPTQKRSDSTLIFHMKGTAAPLVTTMLQQKLDTSFEPRHEWHWAIIGAKGIAPSSTPK
jgi:hypothetical protein